MLRRAQEIRAEQERAAADYTSARTAGLTAQAITRWFGKTLPRLIAPFLRDPH